ncbi:MAG: response regulator [Bacteroidota bacterium]
MLILLVEDNPVDVRLTQEALLEGGFQHKLSVVKDGEEALDYLFQRPPFEEAPVPDLIFLDLNLPKKDGHEVLKEINRASSTRSIPVVILTTSESEQDIQVSYELHANCYITKPSDISNFVEVIKSIESFWSHTVHPPTISRS